MRNWSSCCNAPSPAINGPAIGWVVTLTLACDIRYASEQARLSMRFVRVGLTAELGSTSLLPQVVGPGRAAELLFTGRIIDAAEVERIGLVNRVLPHDQLLEQGMALGGEIAVNPTPHVR